MPLTSTKIEDGTLQSVNVPAANLHVGHSYTTSKRTQLTRSLSVSILSTRPSVRAIQSACHDEILTIPHEIGVAVRRRVAHVLTLERPIRVALVTDTQDLSY